MNDDYALQGQGSGERLLEPFPFALSKHVLSLRLGYRRLSSGEEKE